MDGNVPFAFLFQTVFGEMGVTRRNDAYVEWMNDMMRT
jgi:hypothetical protein